MTTVLFTSSGGGGGVPGGGGCGTAASRPFGVNGVIVIKITSSTSKISINGVTLISAFAEIFFLTFFIAGLLLADLIVEPLRQQTNLVNTCIPDGVDNLNHIAIFRAKIALDEDFLFQPRRQEIIHLCRKSVDTDLFLS